MKYKVGDRVRIKSIDWYNKNKNNNDDVVIEDGLWFSKPMSIFCGKELIIGEIFHNSNPPYYVMKNNMFAWTDEMIEGFAEEPVLTAPNITETVFIHEKDMKWTTEYILPDGYIFKDENGNVINATKIILEKKKKEYPKTYEECCSILGFDEFLYSNTPINPWYKWKLFHALNMLIVCRDTYWKIAGDEMGLGKPWEPENPTKHYIFTIETCGGDIIKNAITSKWINRIFVFPTEEMRDTFYENFKELIEQCKELL